MEWIENIQLRAFTCKDRDKAVTVFHELLTPEPETGIGEIALFRNPVLETDLVIMIRWQKTVPPQGKSNLGFQLAAVFSEFGQIYHSVWTRDSRLNLKKERHQ